MGPPSNRAHDRRMWNDDGQSFKAFTISSALDLVISAVSVVNPAVGLVFGLAKAALVVAADIHQGKPLVASLVKGATSMVGAAVGAVGGALLPGGGGIVSDVLAGLGRSLLSNAANSAMRAITVDENGGLGWNSKAFINGVVGKDAMVGYITGAVTSAVGGALGESQGVFGTDGALKDFNGFIASSAGTLTQFALTGKADFNIMNLAMLGLKFKTKVKGPDGKPIKGPDGKPLTVEKPFSMGLLEMHVGSDGLSMNFGTGGQDLTQGLGVLANIQRIDYLLQKNNAIVANKNLDPIRDGIRYQYLNGTDTNKAQADRLVNGVDKLFWGTGSALAQTVTKDGQRSVYLNISHLMQRGDLSQAAIAITLAHESERDGIESVDQVKETETAVLSHVLMAKSLKDSGVAISPDMEQEVLKYQTGGEKALKEWARENYKSNADFWETKVRLGLNGKSMITLVDDGKADVTDEEGKLIHSFEKKEDALKYYFGLNDQEAKEAALPTLLAYNDPINKESIVRQVPSQHSLFYNYLAESPVLNNRFEELVNSLSPLEQGLYKLNKPDIFDIDPLSSVTTSVSGKPMDPQAELKLLKSYYNSTSVGFDPSLSVFNEIYNQSGKTGTKLAGLIVPGGDAADLNTSLRAITQVAFERAAQGEPAYFPSTGSYSQVMQGFITGVALGTLTFLPGGSSLNVERAALQAELRVASAEIKAASLETRVFEKLQTLVDDTWAKIESGALPVLVTGKQQPETVAGQMLDQQVRNEMRKWVNSGILTKQEADMITINSRWYDLSGTGKFGIPDYKVGNTVMDVTTAPKGWNTLQIEKWNSMYNLNQYTIIRPSAKGGSYTLINPNLKKTLINIMKLKL